MNWREKLQEAVAEVTGTSPGAAPDAFAPSAYKSGESVIPPSLAGRGVLEDLHITKVLTAIAGLQDATEVNAKAAKADVTGQNECAPIGGTGKFTEGDGCPRCGSPSQIWHEPTGRWSCARCFMPFPAADGWPAHLCRDCHKCDWHWEPSEKQWVCKNCTSDRGPREDSPGDVELRRDGEHRPEAA